MSDASPLQNVFMALLELYNLIEQFGSKEETNDFSYDDIVLIALASKSIMHTREALRLAMVDYAVSEEAIILLRSAYEATVLFLYLNRYPEQISKYRAYSALTELRNKMEMVEFAGNELCDSDMEDQLKKNQENRTIIINESYHIYFNLSEDDLNNLERLKKVTNKAHFISFSEMQKSLLEDPFSSGLVKTAFQVYNLGSQMAHSHYSMTINTYLLDRPHPIYNNYTIAWQIAILFAWNGFGLAALNRMRPGFIDRMDSGLHNILAQIRQASGDPTPFPDYPVRNQESVI